MESVKRILGKLAQPRVLLTLLVVAVFVASAVFAYNKFIKPGMNASYKANKELVLWN